MSNTNMADENCFFSGESGHLNKAWTKTKSLLYELRIALSSKIEWNKAEVQILQIES